MWLESVWIEVNQTTTAQMIEKDVTIRRKRFNFQDPKDSARKLCMGKPLKTFGEHEFCSYGTLALSLFFAWRATNRFSLLVLPFLPTTYPRAVPDCTHFFLLNQIQCSRSSSITEVVVDKLLVPPFLQCQIYVSSKQRNPSSSITQ